MAETLRNFSYIVDGKLAGSAHPGFGFSSAEALVAALRAAGVGAVVSLDEAGLSAPVLRDSGIEHLHLPVPDFHPPSLGQIAQFVAFVDANAQAGRATLAHCHAGIGRTGTMLAGYLVAHGADPREAIAQVRTKRPGSIETYAQEDALFAFYRSLESASAEGPGGSEPSDEAGDPGASPSSGGGEGEGE
jgi:atypical dual specificity phosphatase